MSVRFLFPTTIEAASATLAAPAHAEVHAGGTDVVDRLQHEVDAPEALVHLGRLPRPDVIARDVDGAMTIDARTTLAAVESDAVLARTAKVLVEAARATATPQIRSAATMGGALGQHVRCWYYRHPELTCLRRGGAECLARDGEHDHHAIFERGACIAVHPSTVGAALLALDAQLDVVGPAGRRTLTMVQLFDVNVWDPVEDNTLRRGELVARVRVPDARAWRQRYLRASARRFADWADVEVALAVRVEAGVVRAARVALGAVARAPRRAVAAEDALVGRALTDDVIVAAAGAATHGATPLAKNAHKVALVEGLVRTALEDVRDDG